MLRPRRHVEGHGQVVVLRVPVNPWVGPFRLVLIAAVGAHEVGRVGAVAIEHEVADAVDKDFLRRHGEALGAQVQHAAHVEAFVHQQARLCRRNLHGLNRRLLVVNLQGVLIRPVLLHVLQVEPHQSVVLCIDTVHTRALVDDERLEFVALAAQSVDGGQVVQRQRAEHVVVGLDGAEL